MKKLFLIVCILTTVMCELKENENANKLQTTSRVIGQGDKTVLRTNDDLNFDGNEKTEVEFFKEPRRIIRNVDGVRMEKKEGGNNGYYKNSTTDHVIDGICTSIDARHSMQNLNNIKNCVVIEGYVRIMQIHFNEDESNVENFTFPKLREITGYLLLYRVHGLLSLTKLFPNLEVIRGFNLLTGFALMVYEMPNLQELGLKNLLAISSGGVLIEKNPNLCYVDTVNWNAIVSDNDISIKYNKPGRSCAGCHATCNNSHCWNSTNCQITVKPDHCHSECLGRCHGVDDSSCYVCKHYRYQEKCMPKCPKNLYGYLSRRCLTRDECLMINREEKQNAIGINDSSIWRPFNGSCIMKCPNGYGDFHDPNNGLTCRNCAAGGYCRGNIEIVENVGIDFDEDDHESNVEKRSENFPRELVESLVLTREAKPYSAKGSRSVGGISSRQSSSKNLPTTKTKPEERKRAKNTNKINVSTDGICPSTDLRNSVDKFESIENCVIIEGFLQIVLIDDIQDNAFENVTFPKLREITGYLLLYRVTGLKSLTNMFPNLEVIRGQNLLTDYALMAYEMPNLQELGLAKLVEISRGGVRIEKNPTLCYVDTIDWNLIVAGGYDVFIKNNNNESCPGCRSTCNDNHCWTSQHCQKKSKPECHSECLGWCFGVEDSSCYVCKHFRHKGKCIAQCPKDLYGYLSTRCITEEECLGMRPPTPQNLWREYDEPVLRPFNGSCINQCPIGYEDHVNSRNITTCRECTGPCRRVLGGETIRNMADAQRYRGMNVVQGGLEFHIENANRNIMNELVESFGAIEEITGYLKVMHSFPITSLAFFKNLRVIKGDPLDTNNASLTIVDNPNLSNLFAKDQKIDIQKGRLFFHYNPKLCMSKIQELGVMTGIENFSKVEVDPESNGEKVACNVVNIFIEVVNNGPNSATIKWNNYVPPQGQRLFGYILNYIATESKNVTVFDSNFCGNNTWQTVDVDIPISQDNSTISRTITGLHPYTRYALFVKTYTSRNENSFASSPGQSEINFFRTESDIPSTPTNLSSIAVSDTEIMLSWGPPDQPNGPIGYYLISGFVRTDERDILEARDYCKYGLVPETEESPITEVEHVIITTEKIRTINDTKDCCKKDQDVIPVIPTPPKDFGIMCSENQSISMFISGEKNYCPSPGIRYLEPVVTQQTYETFFFNISAQNNSYLIKNLTHYAMYTISISACGLKLPNNSEQCSDVQYTTTRTAKKDDADDVYNLNATVFNDTIVTVTWDLIESPNGLTVSYTIEHTNLDVKNAKTSSECLTEKKVREEGNKITIEKLSPGKYNVRVRSTSLAGDGRFSEMAEFIIPVHDNNSTGVATQANGNNSTGVVIGLCFAFVAVAIISILCFVYRRRQNKIKQIRLIASVNPDYIETKYVIDDWEVPREDVQILEELGLGNFGMVYRGILNGTRNVAIKTISENANFREKNEFLNEASVMKNFSTFHIIKLLGVVSVGSPPYVIMELMENGDLKTYLRKIRDTNLVPNFSRICRMAAEIADGMAYLESKKFVHRDLAARNCMISKDLVCKIGDFGMARDIYETDYYKIGKKGLLPIRWMAPENLSDGVFTSDSDVWSYGVVLYEILTLAEIPYQGFSNEEVLNYVLRKGTVDIPKNCPEIIYKILQRCFKWRPNDRPTFLEIVSELEPFLSQDFCTASFYHSSEGVEIRNSGIKKVYHNAAPIRFYFGNETARWVKDFEDNVMLLDQTKAGSSRGRIFKNGFQQFGNDSAMEDVSLDR